MDIRIALCEDEEAAINEFRGQIARFRAENHVSIVLSVYTNPIQLLEKYVPENDIIFMDIRMPHMDGMEAAHRLREVDPHVILIFLTSLTQYAIEGYSVGAFDYLVKPVNYYDFALKLSRALDRIPENHTNRVLINTENGWQGLLPGNIRYIETDGHHIVYHTVHGDFRQYASLRDAEEKLAGCGFARCNQSYLVNMKYIKLIKGYSLMLDNCTLQISQPKKKEFSRLYKDYLSGKP